MMKRGQLDDTFHVPHRRGGALFDVTAHSRPRGEPLLRLIAMWKHHTLHVFQQKQKGSEPLSSAVKSQLILKEKLSLLVRRDKNASQGNATESRHFWQLFDINANQNWFTSLDFTDSFNRRYIFPTRTRARCVFSVSELTVSSSSG